MNNNQDQPEREETVTLTPRVHESISRIEAALAPLLKEPPKPLFPSSIRYPSPVQIQQHIERHILEEIPELENLAKQASKLTGASYYEALTTLYKLAKEKE